MNTPLTLSQTRLVLAGAKDKLLKVTLDMLPQNISDSYFGYCDLSNLDLFFHNMTNVTIFGCNVDNLRLPGAITTGHRQRRLNFTRNHNLYLRHNVNWETIILPPHIPPDNLAMLTTLFHQKMQEAKGRTRRIIAEVVEYLSTSYDRSWIPARHRWKELVGDEKFNEVLKFVTEGHPDVEKFWAHLMKSDVSLTDFKPLPFEYPNMRADLPLWSIANLPLPKHPQDRYDVERQVEEVYWEHMDISNRCHIWELEPLRMMSGPTQDYENPHWWVGLWGNG